MLSILKVQPNRNISFGRAIKPHEENQLAEASAEAKKYLGIKKLALGIHASSFPVENGDLFVGSHLNQKAIELNKFAKIFGFSDMQLGPDGLISRWNNSPYNSSVFSKNYIYADLKKLTGEEYGKILNPFELHLKTSSTYEASSDMSDFKRSFDAHDELFKKAYENMNLKSNSAAKKLKSEFFQYKKGAQNWLKTDAVYEVLSKKFGNDYYANWEDDIAKNLMDYLNDSKHPKHKEAIGYLRKIYRENSKEIDIYKFKQFIMNKQEKEFIKQNPQKLDYISDAIIGFSHRDYWANPDCFLKDYRIGCPFGGEGKYLGNWTPVGENQLWDGYVINPKTLFNQDGTLGKGGMLLKQKFASLLETYQNIRIDHALGLVNPWIYDKNKIEIIKNTEGKIIQTNAYGAPLSKYGKPNGYSVNGWDDKITQNIYKELNNRVEKAPNLDPEGNYLKVLEKIILPIFKEKGLDPNDAVWETLGHPPDYFNEIFKEKLKLSEISDLKWEKGQTAPSKNWFLISSHDDPPFSQIVGKKYLQENRSWATNPFYLIGYLHPEKTDSQKGVLIDSLEKKPSNLLYAKYEDMIRSGEKIQISFMDFFGLSKTYNKKGSVDKNNWRLRLNKDYQQDFYRNLELQGAEEETKGVALNLPKIFKQAIISKSIHNGEFEKMQPLIKTLEKFEKILYEPEIILKELANKTTKTIIKEIA